MLARYSSINQKYWNALERGELTKPQVLSGRFQEFFQSEGIEFSDIEGFNHAYQIQLGETVVFRDHGYEPVSYTHLISDSYVIVAAPDGEIIYATDGVNFYAYENSKVPESVVSQVLERGSYAGMTSLGGIFPERRYLASLPITVSLNNLSVTQGLVLVSADASSLAEMWSATATIFFFTAVVVLLIAFVASSLFSAHQARPLKMCIRDRFGIVCL